MKRHALEQTTHTFRWLGGAENRVKCHRLLKEMGYENAMAVCGKGQALEMTTAEARKFMRKAQDNGIPGKGYSLLEFR